MLANIIHPNADAYRCDYLLWNESSLRSLNSQNDNVRKRLFPSACPTNGIVGLRIPSMSLTIPTLRGLA